jgi:TRAP-type mannitol/chloroaromatic compound transport system permease small subunit
MKRMNTPLRIAGALDRVVTVFGRLGSWAVLLLVGVTLFDVITRRFLVLGSTRLQELEWHLHTILMMFLIAYGLIRNTHVRVDLFREQLGPYARARLELAGNVLFLVPYALLVICFSFEFVMSSWVMTESSASMTGLSHRWIIKSTLIVAFVLVLAAGISSSIRQLAFLCGRRDENALAHDTGKPSRQGGAERDDD